MQMQDRLAGFATQHLDLAPGDGANTRTQGLGDSLLGSETRCQGSDIMPYLVKLLLSEDAPEKALPVALDSRLEALNFDQIHPIR